MRRSPTAPAAWRMLAALCLAAAALAGCNRQGGADVGRALDSVNVIDESNLSEIMLTVGDPREAVAYFTRAAGENPDRIDLRRGLARSLVRAGQPAEGARVWAEVAAMPGAGPEDRVGEADALIRTGEWDQAAAILAAIPPTYETFDRYRLEAMVADSRQDWARADAFYEIAAGLTTRPAGVLNNWGFSKLNRGDFAGAERLLIEALTYEPGLFTAKNNLVMARGAQGRYDLPLITMTQIERAQLLHTAALTAVKRGDVATGKALLAEAIETHPQHFDAAVRSLAALDGG